MSLVWRCHAVARNEGSAVTTMRHCPEVREVLSVCRPRSSARRERNARRTKECQCPCSCLSLSAYGGSVSEVGRQGPDGPAKDTRHMLLHGARCLSRIERSQASPAKKKSAEQRSKARPSCHVVSLVWRCHTVEDRNEGSAVASIPQRWNAPRARNLV